MKTMDKVKFKVRCSKYLYTLVVTDKEKADKLKQSLPPGTCVLELLIYWPEDVPRQVCVWQICCTQSQGRSCVEQLVQTAHFSHFITESRNVTQGLVINTNCFMHVDLFWHKVCGCRSFSAFHTLIVAVTFSLSLMKVKRPWSFKARIHARTNLLLSLVQTWLWKNWAKVARRTINWYIIICWCFLVINCLFMTTMLISFENQNYHCFIQSHAQ